MAENPSDNHPSGEPEPSSAREPSGQRRFCPSCDAVVDAAHERCPDCDGALAWYADERSRRLIGRTLDNRYDIVELLGEGGMGAVYRARQRAVHREVAVKVLPREMSRDRRAIKRFFQEARAASSLTHPNTITVFDFGQTSDGLLYYVMELLDGHSLAELIQRTGPLPAERAVRVLAQVCDSLTESHAKGIIHRDLKPANIHVHDQPGNPDFVKVLDFGIAKVQTGVDTITRTGEICGTPAYMAPEAAMGRELGPTADVYALGVILYEMLAGRPPFRADTPMALLLKQIHDPVPPLRDNPGVVDVPEALDALLLRVLAKEPEDRPQSARDLKELARAAMQRHRRSPTNVRLRPIGSYDSQPSAPAAPSPTELRPPSGDAELSAAETINADVDTPTEVAVPVPATFGGAIPPSDETASGWPPAAPMPLARRVAVWVVAGLVGLAAVAGVLYLLRAPDGRGDAAGGGAADPPPAVADSTPGDKPGAADRPTARPDVGRDVVSPATPTAPDVIAALDVIAAPGPGVDTAAPVRDASAFKRGLNAPARPDAAVAAAAPDVAAAVATVRITLDSRPPGARVSAGKTPLGVTPFVWTPERSSEEVELVFVRRGFRKATLSVAPDADARHEVRLRKRRRGGKRPGIEGMDLIRR